MKKTISRFSIVALSLCLITILCICTLVVVNTEAVDIASAAGSSETLEELSKKYTNSDTIYGMQQSITEYPTSLYKTKVSLNKNKLQISGDDPIVNIVPRDYFATVGEHLYIGKEYGFFVNTKQQSSTSQNKIAEVFVFDIITNNDLETTISRLIVRVEPIFQYCYALVSGAESMVKNTEQSITCDYSIESSANYVVPLPNNNKQFEQYDKYYLKDISFGATLLNEQELNTVNSQYDPVVDDGSFIIMQDYVYNCVVRDEEGRMQATDKLGDSIIGLSTSVLGFGLGLLSIIPIVPFNACFGILSFCTSGASILFSAADVVDKKNDLPPMDISATNGKITATCNYTTRRDQLAHYVDEQTKKPALAKAATIIVDGDDGTGNLWYNVGSYAEGYFTLSDSAPTNPWLTRV